LCSDVDECSAVPQVLQLSASSYAGTTCVTLQPRGVKCWGFNSHGELGLGDTFTRGDELGEMGNALPAVDLGTGRSAVRVEVGDGFACALLDDGSVKCWGYNSKGQLGQGDLDYRGDDSGEMGDNLTAIDLGTGRTAVSISAGAYHTCAVLDDGSVKCWGSNADGILGLGDLENRGDDSDEMGDNLPSVDLGTERTALSISAGGYHTCAVLDDGSVKCWGENYYGQLGLGDVEYRGDDIGEMGDNLTSVDLGTERTAVSISAGESHTCAVLDDGSVKCWGENYDGQLGLGDVIGRGDDIGEMGDALEAVEVVGETSVCEVISVCEWCADQVAWLMEGKV